MSIRISFTRVLVASTALTLLAACTTTHAVNRYDGRIEYDIACGQAVDWSVCHDEAKGRCPYGYDTLSQDIGFTAKELRVLCYATPRTAASDIAAAESPPHLSATTTTKPCKVFVTSEPHSLLLEDVARKMIAGPALIVVDDKTSADMVLKIEAYNFDFNDSGSDAQHYSLGKYQVQNLVGAALYMPEASSYNIDIQHFHTEAAYEFAYIVSTRMKNEIGQKVIRDHMMRDTVQCSQPTINNAFGGVVPAQFWASDELQAQCAGGGDRPSKAEMESSAKDEIGRQMRAHLVSLKTPEPTAKTSRNRRKKQNPE